MTPDTAVHLEEIIVRTMRKLIFHFGYTREGLIRLVDLAVAATPGP